ncbi:hypothetical protein BDV96DRAFT_453613, partial [Lophiotrema nucula]
MAPIRVGIVGLSASPGGSGWAKETHLPYLQASPAYEITGILNSTLESSQEAVRAFKLTDTAKPFPDIETMAADPDIDLITVCVEVKSHAHFVKVALEHSKHVYCEWPLAKDLKETEELAALAKSKGIQGYVGLESRLSPVSVKLRELLSESIIGKVLSTDVTGTLGTPPKIWSEKALFYLDVNSGQSPLHTRFGHFLDAFCFIVGELDEFTSLLATHEKEVKVYDVAVPLLAQAATNPDATSRMVQRTSPDEILIHGKLTSGALTSLHIRSGSTDADGNNLRWLITGTEGVIEVTQKAGQFL